MLIKMKENQKWKILHTVFERQTLCFCTYKNHELKIKLYELELTDKRRGHFLYHLFCLKEIFLGFVFYLNV